MTQTTRAVRNCVLRPGERERGSQVAQQSLDLARTSLKNNQRRVEVGTMAPIDIVQAQAEVAANEESVIVAEGQIRAAEDRLRTLVLNPSSAGLLDHAAGTLGPADADAAAGGHGRGRRQRPGQPDRPRAGAQDRSIDRHHDALLPQPGPAGARRHRRVQPGRHRRHAAASSDSIPRPGRRFVLGTIAARLQPMRSHDVFGNQFRTWSMQLNVSYPLGRSVAEASVAQGQLQHEQQRPRCRIWRRRSSRRCARPGGRSIPRCKRVESTRKARELAEKSLQAEEKRLAVGLSDTFLLLPGASAIWRASASTS